MTKPKEALQSRRALRNRATENYTDTDNISRGTNANVIPESPAKTSKTDNPEPIKVCILYCFRSSCKILDSRCDTSPYVKI